jgi:hypothetical protein
MVTGKSGFIFVVPNYINDDLNYEGYEDDINSFVVNEHKSNYKNALSIFKDDKKILEMFLTFLMSSVDVDYLYESYLKSKRRGY